MTSGDEWFKREYPRIALRAHLPGDDRRIMIIAIRAYNAGQAKSKDLEEKINELSNAE